MRWPIFAIVIFAINPAIAQQRLATPIPTSLSDQFLELCGSEQAVIARLPGEDVQTADAPFQLKQYAESATNSRVVKIGERYAMRSHNPARADPVHALIIRCAVTGHGSLFSDEVEKLSKSLSATPNVSKTGSGFESASFRSGLRSFQVFAEADGWVSVFSLDIVMHDIDPKYLKNGVKPLAIPPAQ